MPIIPFREVSKTRMLFNLSLITFLQAYQAFPTAGKDTFEEQALGSMLESCNSPRGFNPDSCETARLVEESQDQVIETFGNQEIR
jgi:hypothetical protein